MFAGIRPSSAIILLNFVMKIITHRFFVDLVIISLIFFLLIALY